MLEDNKERIVDALYKDLHKHKLEALSVDVCGIQTASVYTLKHLKSWASDDKPSRFNPLNFFGGTRVRKEPKGVVLILSAWNYPFMELLEPMISALAAGCCVILKPSELATASEVLIQEIVPQYLDQDAIQVLTAGPAEMKYILQKRWDHIFFTGSATVGKIIYENAARHLTSVTLELGGQGPAFVSAKADIDLAAKRIAAAKFMNAGQVCLSVNHVFVDPIVKERFISSLIKHFKQFLGGSQIPDYYSHIINKRNFDRLSALLDQTSGKIVYGGERNPETLSFSPTVVVDVSPSDSLMSEELFGPILPILDATLDQAISHTTNNERPLAVYPFTTSQAEKDKVLGSTISGGVCINDAIVHTLSEGAPFGGTGYSGMGAYHGPYGFKEFTHMRTVVDIPKWMDIILRPRFPPYTEKSAIALSKAFRPVDKAWFDRDGRDTRWTSWQRKIVLRSLLAFAIALAALKARAMGLDFARSLASSPRFQKALRVGAALTLVIGTNRLLTQLALNNLSKTHQWDWSEDIVMVTGGCNGIGELVCRKLASHGIKVVAVDLQPPRVPFPDNIFYYRLDVTSSQDISQIAKSIRQDVGEPTVLINNAGVASLKTILGESEEEIRRTFDVNVVAHFLLAREFLPWMIRQDHGHIITIASMASYITVASGVDYCASKAAALAFHEGLAQELKYKYNAKHCGAPDVDSN
ncbi:hypothetical protein LRP88_04327 [Fusarium phalaenopsidis]